MLNVIRNHPESPGTCSTLQHCHAANISTIETISFNRRTRAVNALGPRFTHVQELKKRRVEDGKKTDARDGGSTASGTGARGRARGGSETEEPSASFLDKMRSEQVDGMGLEERMHRNRHYHQRGADAHNFMDRG